MAGFERRTWRIGAYNELEGGCLSSGQLRHRRATRGGTIICYLSLREFGVKMKENQWFDQ